MRAGVAHGKIGSMCERWRLLRGVREKDSCVDFVCSFYQNMTKYGKIYLHVHKATIGERFVMLMNIQIPCFPSA